MNGTKIKGLYRDNYDLQLVDFELRREITLAIFNLVRWILTRTEAFLQEVVVDIRDSTTDLVVANCHAAERAMCQVKGNL
jgi:hypothetical protein